jgi:LacI family transcriptional regulator
LIADAQESDRLEREALDRAIPTVEGIILASTRMSNSAIRMTAKQRPTIVLNRDVSDASCLAVDHAQAMRHAVEHLQELKHDKITYLAGPEAAWADGMRWRALLSLASERGLQVRRLGPYDPTVVGGVAAAEDLRRAPTPAAIAYNDLMAIGVIRGLLAFGARVPADVSVVGFDNIFGADLITPGLTTVAAPLRTMGSMAVHNLLALIAGARASTGEPVTLPTRLVIRESTGERSIRRAARAPGSKKAAGSRSKSSRSASAT